MSTDLLFALRSDDPEDVERVCEVEFAEACESFRRFLPLALSGSRDAARRYVAVWRQVTDSVLGDLHEAERHAVLAIGDQLYVADVKGTPAVGSSLVLEFGALEAPFSSWVTRAPDVGLGVCAALIQKVREVTPGLSPIPLALNALPHWPQSETQMRTFRRHVTDALSEADPPLERIRHVFDLSLTQLGDLFGVSRQAVTQWLESGIPNDRMSKVTTVTSIADLLAYRLHSDRIPGIVRRPAPAYDGLSALDMIRNDRHDELLELVRASFDWAEPA